MNITQNFSLIDELTENLNYGLIVTPAQERQTSTYSWQNGTAASQVDLHWELAGSTAVTLTAGTSATYTLSALTDAIGRTVAFVRIRKLVIRITSKTDGDATYLTIGGAASHDWTAIVSATGHTLPCRDALVMIAGDTTGLAVTASSSDQLKVKNDSSHSITFEISISGCSV